jgi:hypothetical protein
MLSPTVAGADRDRLRATFDRFDRDNSETIDLDELSEVMANLGVVTTQAQLADLVQQANVNERNELEFDAFAQLLEIWREAAKLKLFEDNSLSSRAKMESALSLSSWLLLSDSTARCVFDAAVLSAALTYYIIILLDDAVKYSLATAVTSAQVLVLLTSVADMAVSAVTYRGVDETKHAVRQYLTSWFAIDLLSAIPWIFITNGVAGTILRHVPFLKLLKMSAFWSASGRVPMTANYISFHYKVLPITLLAIIFAIMVHGFTVGFMLVKQSNGTDQLIYDGTYPYSAAVYYVVYTLGTVGFGNIEISESNEKLYCCLVLCGSILSNGFVIGKLVAIMQRADLQQDRRGKLRQTLAVLDHFDLPKALQDEVLQFQDHLLGHALGASYASTLNGLPAEMHGNVNIVVKVRLLSCVEVFAGLHAVVKVALAQALNNVVLVPEQYVLGYMEEVKTMYFIAHGFVDVLDTNGTRIKTLSANGYFAAGMLIEGTVSNVSVKALGYCDLWALSRADLVAQATKFPPLRKVLTDVASHCSDFECQKAPAPSEDSLKRNTHVSLIDVKPPTPATGTERDGELEDASHVQQLCRRTERLAKLANRLYVATERLQAIPGIGAA